MSIQVVWDDQEETIIRWDFSEGWTWDEFRAAFNRSVEIGSHLEYRLDVVSNVTNVKTLPLGALGEFRRTENKMTPNVHLVIIAGATTMTNIVIETFAKVYRAEKWRTARSLEDARQIITKDRMKAQ